MTDKERIQKLETALMNAVECIEDYDAGACCQDERALLRKPCHGCTCGLKERLAVESSCDGDPDQEVTPRAPA
jgi:hypothetical protein